MAKRLNNETETTNNVVKNFEYYTKLIASFTLELVSIMRSLKAEIFSNIELTEQQSNELITSLDNKVNELKAIAENKKRELFNQEKAKIQNKLSEILAKFNITEKIYFSYDVNAENKITILTETEQQQQTKTTRSRNTNKTKQEIFPYSKHKKKQIIEIICVDKADNKEYIFDSHSTMFNRKQFDKSEIYLNKLCKQVNGDSNINNKQLNNIGGINLEYKLEFLKLHYNSIIYVHTDGTRFNWITLQDC